ncbi:MAG: peptide chain release factor N(5)-glutamine methyltransferase [Rikenellaceae bacterium]|jgi:release factor glutamine methyltransferase|nr:peptide chain release factor N(5)-glutamine methyltransferase [Rikenellaceae bacterium]
MTRKSLFENTCSALSAIYPAKESRINALILLEAFWGWPAHTVFIDGTALVEADDAIRQRFEKAVAEMQAHRPLQYVLGKAWFGNREFLVDERVLIPRPETEELVRLVISENRTKSQKILDIGTGSGCIAVTLALELPDAAVTALDISPGALTVAHENAVALGATVEFRQGDILCENLLGEYDVIVSNPPYVCCSEREAMRPNVLGHEPATALFVPDGDPLLFFRRIAELGQQALRPGGHLYFEINERMGARVESLLHLQGYDRVRILKDIFDRERIVAAQWN